MKVYMKTYHRPVHSFLGKASDLEVAVAAINKFLRGRKVQPIGLLISDGEYLVNILNRHLYGRKIQPIGESLYQH